MLSAIRDAFARRAVAWETSARADADLMPTTLEYALASREVEPGKLVHYADHGFQYTLVMLTTWMLRAGVQASMGSVGDSYDKALADDRPPRQSARAQVDYGREIAELSAADAEVGDVTDVLRVHLRGGEVAADQIRCLRRGRVRDGGAVPAPQGTPRPRWPA